MDRYYQASVTTPAGTAIAAPLVTVVPLENSLLVDVEIQIPPGHAGLTGINIMQSGQQIIPWANLSWIVADNYVNRFDANTEIGSRSISVRTYNADVFNHTFYVRFHIRDLATNAATSPSAASGALVGAITEGFDSNTIPASPGNPDDTPGGGLFPLPPPPPIFALPPPP